ncbi:hypothetical protein JCM11251_003315 [Rhodosporidiobolus azoricus]
MAMITLAGYPCSGKSTRAQELVSHLERRLANPSTPPQFARLKPVVVNDESLGLAKSVYDDARAEKPARASLFSAAQRNLGKDKIVIVDAMNYIKGSRYQMYCAAREAQVRTCTLFIATPPNQCKEWNEGRTGDARYAEATLDNLISRFEEPNSVARWDAPLITVASDDPPLTTRPDPAEEGDFGSEAAERIWAAITEGDIKPANAAVQVAQTSSTSYLTLLESTTSSLISTLLSRQSLSPLSGSTLLVLPSTPTSPTPIRVEVSLFKPVTMPQLQRLKRQFTTLNVKTGREFGAETIASMFAEYLQGQLR